MDLLEFGHAGATIIAFPTSKGSFFEWEDQGMTRAMRHQLEHGHFRLICIDSVDTESWYAYWKHPGSRVWRQMEYDNYVYHEVLPFVHSRTNNHYVITAGASFGAYHALSFGLRHPDRIHRVLSMSGLCDIKMFADGFYNDTVYALNPVDFIPHEHDPYRLMHMRNQDIVLAVGNGDKLLHQNRELSGKLWNKGVGNALREWDGFSHDWPVWHQMINLYVGGHD
ncbi:MAG: esterase family protein [Fimbriiglobus sp.]